MTTDPDAIARAADERLARERQQQVDVVRALAAAEQVRTDAAARLKDADSEHAKAWRTALRSGWDERALSDLGLTAPNKRTPGRPRSAKPAQQSDTDAQQ